MIVAPWHLQKLRIRRTCHPFGAGWHDLHPHSFHPWRLWKKNGSMVSRIFTFLCHCGYCTLGAFCFPTVWVGPPVRFYHQRLLDTLSNCTLSTKLVTRTHGERPTFQPQNPRSSDRRQGFQASGHRIGSQLEWELTPHNGIYRLYMVIYGYIVSSWLIESPNDLPTDHRSFTRN